MLPTKGYFQDIDCPYYDSSCGRPYCHFRHKKKHQDSGNDSPKEPEIPTYNPTPKSQLNNRSHIPISYVPDLTFRPERTSRSVQKFVYEKPTYKPTPLSVLSCVNKQETSELNEVKESVSENKSEVNLISDTKQNVLDVEYSPVNDNIDTSIQYTPTSESNRSLEGQSEREYTPSGETSGFEYKPTSNTSNIVDQSDTHYLPSGDNLNIEYHPTPQSENENNSSSIDFEGLDNEFDMIDEIINDNSVDDPKITDTKKSKKQAKPKNSIKHSSSKETSNQTKSNPKDRDSKRHKNHSRHDDKKSSNKHNEKGKEEIESKSKEHISKYSKSEGNKNSCDKDKLKSKEKPKASHATTNHETKKYSSSRHKTKHKSKERDKEKSKNKHSHKSSDSNHKHSSKEKLSKTKSEHKLKTSDDKKIKNEKEKDKVKHKSSEIVKKHSESESENSISKRNSPTSINNTEEFEIESEDDDTMLECYRIFNEYKAPVTSEVSVDQPLKQEQAEDELFIGRKRVAHSNAEKVTQKIQPHVINHVTSAAQTMTNRFKVARAIQASNEQNNIMSEVKSISVKRLAPPSLAAAVKNYKIQKTLRDSQVNKNIASASLVDNIISGTQRTSNAVAKFSQRKIAPVFNVEMMQKAKERIEEIKQKATESNKTPAHIIKGAKRVAHVPEFSLAEIPDVLQADKSKLPVNVRTRFLTMIAEECIKLYLTKEDAYTRALNEEFTCYEKCKVLITYKNSAMLAVNRIRKEHQERTRQGLEPLSSNEESDKGRLLNFKGNKFHDNVKKYMLTDEELDIHCYPRESDIPGKAVIKNKKSKSSVRLEEHQRKCARCSKIYIVDEDGFAFYEEECLYHPLKKRTLRGEQTYLCCKSNDETGCSTSHTHVSEYMDDSELEGYQTTMEPEGSDDPKSVAVYALDCEMCYTTRGLELTRVTIIDVECKTVYDSLVRPLNPIIDYNTRFSGITKEQMDRTSTSILQVQANILHLCNSETILIGHSLESDLKALKIIHSNIVDTSVLFPHRLGLPHKRALRALASEYLKKIIQNDVAGHNSAEDAITCMELVRWKLSEDLKVRGLK